MLRRRNSKRWCALEVFVSATLVGAALLSGCAHSSADATAPASESRAQTATGAFAELNALGRTAAGLKTPLAQYEFYRERYERSDGVVRGFIAQVLAAKAAELGAYREAVLLYPHGAPLLRAQPAALPDPGDFHAEPAVEALAALARERRIVMLNEAHHAAQTRVLTLQLLPRLRALGYTHVAVEGLSESDRDLAPRGYPVAASGPYIDEPLYGDIVRQALRLGFAVVAYESAALDEAEREEEQAQHLVERVFRADRNARLLVHAGYAHVHKSALYLDTDTMAMRLARKTGFDPLVVDQAVLRPAGAGREYADYRTLIGRFPIREPSVFVGAGGTLPWSLEPGVYDVSVLLPPGNLVNDRPDWLALGGERTPVAIALDLRPESLPCVLEARYAGESDAAVPADRILIERADAPTVLFLRPGDYRVAASTANGRAFSKQRLHVDPQTARER